MTAELKPGDVVRVERAASVQFVAQPITFRVIKVREDLITYHGWLWLDGYQLDEKGDAVERRTIFVKPAGLRLIPRRAHRDPGRVPGSRRTGASVGAGRTNR